MEEIIYPVRINKYLAVKKICTRRKADELIKAGKVLINGQRALLGAKVQASDTVGVDEGTKKKMAQEYVYLAYNKPRGVTTHSAPEGKEEIEDIFQYQPPARHAGDAAGKVFPIGRLDEDSYGLILMTNDGRVTDRLLKPKYSHEKEYSVTVNKLITQHFLTQMAKGVKIEDGITKKARVMEAGSKSFRITLTEGKKHQIRRMCTALGYEVIDLERTRIMNIKLLGLQPGAHRKLEGVELKTFLASIGLDSIF